MVGDFRLRTPPARRVHRNAPASIWQLARFAARFHGACRADGVPFRDRRRLIRGNLDQFRYFWTDISLSGDFDDPALAVAFAVRIWHRSAVAGDNPATVFKDAGVAQG